MSRVMSGARKVAGGALQGGPLRRAALWVGRTRGLVVLYHRLGPVAGSGIVPTISPTRLRAHLEVILRSGPVVTLDELLEPAEGGGPRFAITFDDDYQSHVDAALPVLRDAGVPATFFLCGRALNDLGAPWWERLERLLDDRGATFVADALGLPAGAPGGWGEILEQDPERQQRIPETVGSEPSPLAAAGMRALAEAGMDVGFHTLHHPLLTQLDDAALDRALVEGHATLSEIVGRPLVHVAYPHGKADRRVAAAARRAGYRAGWTGWPAPLRARSDRFLLPRWEPGALDPDHFAAALAVRLLRTAPAHRSALRG